MKVKVKQKSTGKIGYPELKDKYRLLQDLMDNIPDVIYFKDALGRLILVNKAHAKGLGLKPEEVAGKTDFDIFPKERAEKMFKDDIYVIKTGKPIIDKIERATRADGVDNYVSTTKIPRYDEKGNVIGLIGITRDITSRMQFEHMRQEREQVNKKLEALEHLNRTKSEFVSVVSHELRIPLAIIKEAVMLIFDNLAGPVTKKQKGLLGKAKNNVERLKIIIDELLDMSRIEKGTFRLHYSLVNLNDLISDSSAFFKKLAQEKGINLKYILPKREVNIFLDSERVNQILSNLINNAIKFTDRNGEIKVELKILEDKVRVSVADTGVGISKNDLPKLFNKFVQVSKTHAAEKKGLGLGLSIVKELTERHGGEIWIESKIGVGSKFYFTLLRFYTTQVLDKSVRENINNLLEKGIPVYLIYVSIVNFKEFRKRLKVRPKKLFHDLKAIIEGIVKDINNKTEAKLQIVPQYYPIVEFNIIFPRATEKETAKLCESLKNRINDYFARIKSENIFINTGITSSTTEGVITGLQPFLNVSFKKIYIGSETRKFRRIPYQADIEAVFPKNKPQTCRAVDISQGGICFLSRKPLKADSQIEIKLKLTHKGKPLCVKGRVAWIKVLEELPREEVNKYKTGLEFINLTKKDKEGISKFIRTYLAPRHIQKLKK